MRRDNEYINKVKGKLAMCCLLLFAFAGSASAQNDPWHVIKKGDHYLAHVGTYDAANDTTIWSLQDATTFDPETCLWHSGNTANVLGLHHNYYFIDTYGNYRFLSAPLLPNGQLSLSATLPSIQLLRNTDQIYYFYDWDPDEHGDRGVARGHKFAGVTNENDCGSGHSWSEEDQECWEVYWVEYDDTQTDPTWKLSGESSYHIPTYGARYRPVTVTEHEQEITSSNPTGVLPELPDYELVYQGSCNPTITIPNEPYAYSCYPAYTTYVFEGGTHNYYAGADHLTQTPPETTYSGTYQSMEWTISGEGADYLSFDETEHHTSSTSTEPTLFYNVPNTTGHHTATLTLTVIYADGNGQLATQVRTSTVVVKSDCLNPGQAGSPVVTYEGVTVSWYPTAEQYRVYLSTNNTTWTEYNEVGNVNTYTFTGLASDTHYYYTVVAYCNGQYLEIDNSKIFDFTTKGEPGLLIYGAVYGGGRMADVGGKTEVAIINCDSIHAVYGGNDIAGTVLGPDGATVTLGVEENDPNEFDDYGTTNAPIRIGDVYGGGNGYYAYNGTSFEAASYNTVYHIAHDASILELTSTQELGDTVWTNTDSSVKDLVCPTITKTTITVTNDSVKIDSLFGGAKNAILNAITDDVSITVNGGTIFSVFGGNNFGGSLGYKSQERILVNHTTTAKGDDYRTGTLGRDFGIGYLFGGGNKVQGQNVFITMNGGQCDTIFGGGNEADVRSTEVTIQCAVGAYDDESGAYGELYTDALNDTYSGGTIDKNNIDGAYLWNRLGIYNVRTLFGGNNRASMEDGVPNLILTSGGIGTVYGGGNEGDMLAAQSADVTYNGNSSVYTINYSTHVQMSSPNILIDYLYGGCQKSNVDYSTLVELQEGHVGTVYGGCNISGDVGSKRVNLNVPSNPPTEAYQEVQGSTYVKASGGIVYNNLFGGSNGFYHCNNGIEYIEGISYCAPEHYVGWPIPTHNETHVIITGEALIKGNVYAGGNMSPVGFTDATVGERIFPVFVGLASLHMDGGVVVGDVFGGGNMASILGSNEVRVSGGSIGMSGTRVGALYGGNDRSGQAGQISNRVFPESYNVASDGYTSLTDVNTYVSVTGRPDINTVYGGGNGDYDYVNGDEVIPQGHYCTYDEQGLFNDKPIQSNTFVDINIDGYPDGEIQGGHINTVYGGGNGVTVTGSITVFLNVENPVAYDHVDTIFGGNNKDNIVELDNAPLVPDIVLLHGQVGTVYGGCNKGAMKTGMDFNIGGNTYYNVGSMVRLRSSYQATTPNAPLVTPNAVVSKAVYGGCRMNDVDRNSLVLVEGGAAVPNTAKLFGGCDISGMVGDTSLVVVTGGQVNGNIYAGGNGNYTYTSDGTVYSIEDTPVLVATGVTNDPPISSVSRIDLLGGNLGTDSNQTVEVFGGGYGQPTQTIGNVIVNVGPATATSWTGLPVIYGDIYGGSAFGDVNTSDTDSTYAITSTTVNFLNGTLHGNLFGGGLGRKPAENVEGIAAKVYGKVFVNISNEDQPANKCFIDLREGNVYGCNNYYGSPQDTVSVHVWKTAFNFSDYLEGDIYKATYTESDADYAIHQVFGGGHEANYVPKGGENTTNKAMVYVHNCINTIQRVFAGGDAADAVGLVDTIQGGRMQYVFGGGNGELAVQYDNDAYAANVGLGGTHLVITGGVIEYLFGGSNQRGDIVGQMYTEVNNDSGCTESITEFYGGCNLAPLTTENGVYSIIKCGAGTIAEAYGGSKLADIEGDVTFDVRGGTITNVFGGSKGQAGDTPEDAADIDGSVTLNLEGGNITNAFGGTNINGNITDSITVNVVDFELDNCGLDLTNVYGGGNLTPYTPTKTTVGPVVNVIHIAQEQGIKGNVFGGAKGDAGHPATVTANPIVNIGYVDALSDYLPSDYRWDTLENFPRAFVTGSVYGGGELSPVLGSTTVNVNNGTVVHKVVGGGKQADISKVVVGGVPVDNTGNTAVYVRGGTIGTDADASDKGVYGGCDQSGNVGGKTLVNLTGGTIGVSTSNTANIHGGGYGDATTVTGNVTVYFGDDTNIENTDLVLYGDVYGGSALGDVNTADQNNPGATTSTTVILRNGIINGGAYGGGLGEKSGVGGATSDNPAFVYGTVYVMVGEASDPSNYNTFTGQANLVNCNVYGCNNLCGSPQSDVYVDVYQTAHTDENLASNHNTGATFAINQVFGGGNRANYTIDGKKDNVWIHGCSNTIYRTFGGGDASDVYGVDIHIDGGRFDIIFGGGNGENYEANIGAGGINLAIGGGYVNTLVNGSNLHGSVSGGDANIHSSNYDSGCGDLVVNEYYLGSNQSDIFGDIDVTISCLDAGHWQYKKLYCGSRWSQIYGNINVTIEGGTFDNVFGGSKGRLPNPNFNPPDPGYESNIYVITEDMVSGPNMIPQLEGRTDLIGHGGNITLTINGGTIGNLFGGCDENGDIDGKISIVVEENNGECSPIFIGDIYGGCNYTNYAPSISCYLPTNPNAIPTPNISILKASQIGGSYDFSNDGEFQEDEIHVGNVFGGGNYGSVTSNPQVIVGKGKEFTTTPVNILGSVFGGGNEGNVTGSPNVVVVPETHDLSYTSEYYNPNPGHETELSGKAFVYDGIGNLLSETGTGNSNKFGEGVDVRIKAIASVYGWKFTGWTATNGTIMNTSDAITLFTMGSDDATATITAAFESVPVHTLSISPSPEHGSISVFDGFNEEVQLPAQIGEGAVLNIVAEPADGYRFVSWLVEGNGSIANPASATTTFTMGSDTGNATISATFESIEEP